MEITEAFTVDIVSSKDQSTQKALFTCPAGDGAARPVPLLVALHTWSFSYVNCVDYLPLAQERGWACVAPDFRGPNNRPEACASELAIQDILDAVEFARTKISIDPTRIYLVGGSGGGHMALMMAAKAPEIWAGISAWVPISDLAAWHHQRQYTAMMELCCGGKPGTPATDKEYRARSPIHFLPRAKGVNLDIYVGIHDGHTGSVPVSHSLKAFNVLAAVNGKPDLQIPNEDINTMEQEEKIPAALASQTTADPELIKPALFRRSAGPVRITVFEGGHDQDTPAALNWLSRQRKGQPADFTIQPENTMAGKRKVQMEAVSH